MREGRALAADLLEQASHLLGRDPSRPKQGSLRRVASASYYAWFHLLVADGAAITSKRALRPIVARSFDHGALKSAARAFSQKSGTDPLVAAAGTVSSELNRVVTSIIELQEARHDADYDLTRRFSRQEATALLSRAREAFADWKKVRGSLEAEALLVKALLGSKPKR